MTLFFMEQLKKKKVSLYSENKKLIIFLIYSGFLCLASKGEVSGFILETQE